jgi:hypothetical protein
VVVLALCPSRGRPAAAQAILESFEATRTRDDTRLVFIVDRDDPSRGDYPGEVMVVPPTGFMNGAVREAIELGVLRDATVIGWVGDDNRFRTPGWDVRIAEGLGTIGIGYPSDGWRKDDLPTNWWITRPIVDALGMFEPTLRHYFTDNYWRALGRATGCYVHFEDVLIEHLHPLAGKAENDAIYDRSKQNAFRDKVAYQRWEKTRKHHDIGVIRKLQRADQPRRVLADWHHPALYESLAILFEDRFGWELYSPTGMDWTEHGWQWEFPASGWDARRFLVFDDLSTVNGHFERREPEYPGRPRKLVTWKQAQAMRWDFVVDSLACHQASFTELASRFGAQAVHQVGNAKHPVPRHGIVLASAAVRRHRPNIVTYHQEFDRGLFAPAEPSDRATVASFMLRLDATSGPWQWLADALPFTAYGGLSPDDPGYVAPMAAVARTMQETGWIWHDKTVGDGYGHVLWTAAAIGRPLIGHAGYFKGMLGEPLWRDLETCIDLDKHPPERAVRLIRGISADSEWYGAMSDELRQTFARLVDFDAEADAIRTALDR